MIELTAEQKRIASDFSRFINEGHPVAMAVEPLREKALERAAKEAQKVIDRVTEQLTAAGNDVNVAAPQPNSLRDSRETYRAKNSKNSLFRRLVTRRQDANNFSYRPNAPYFADINPDACRKFIIEAQKMAALAYDAFIVKLCKKIGDCDAATLSGEHVWGRSTLTVAKGEASERWMTQQIVNYSVLGLPYNQWPSRKVK